MSSFAAIELPITELVALWAPSWFPNYLEMLNLVGLKTRMKDTPNLGKMHRVPGDEILSDSSLSEPWAPLSNISTNCPSGVHWASSTISWALPVTGSVGGYSEALIKVNRSSCNATWLSSYFMNINLVYKTKFELRKYSKIKYNHIEKCQHR